MFPLRDENRTVSTSFATYALIASNVLTWFVLQGYGQTLPLAKSVCEMGAIPGELLGTVPPGVSWVMGAGIHCTVGDSPVYSTLFTSMFLHGGWFHLLSNLWFLFVFGDNVEDVMGVPRFVVFYVLCGLIATAAHLATNATSPIPVVGASGAIGGVMGAYARLYPKVSVHLLVFLGFFFTRVVVPAYLVLGYWFLLQLVGAIPALQGEGAGVAFWAHIGGFVAGLVLIPLFQDPERVAAHARLAQEHPDPYV